MADKDITNVEVCGKIDHLEERLDLFEKNYDAKFDDFTEKFDALYKKVYGNGGEGMTVTLALLNTKMDMIIQRMDDNCKAVKELGKSTPEHWLGKNWKMVLFLATIFFVFLHSILPPDVSLWTLFSKLIGGL